MADLILEMRNITKEFSGVKALDNVNLEVERGEIHALCGENGAGKSTLMNVLSGVYPYGEYSGQIIYNGDECRFHDIRESEHKGIVIIHQELALSPNLSIAENVFLGNPSVARHGVLDWNKIRRESMQILERVGLRGEHVDQLVSNIGVGKQQLIEIAKALAKEVKLLIFDEPTASLNDEESNKLLDLMLSLKQNGITCVMISHKLHEVSRVADRITILRDGKTIETLASGQIDEDRIIKGMVGREIKNRFPSRQSSIGEIGFEVRNWNVFHPDNSAQKVINNVSLNVRRGEVVGLAGLMGAGRTELAMSLFGGAYGQNISGSLLKDGQPLKLHSVRDAIESGLAYVSEDRKTFGLILMNDAKWNMTLPSLSQNFTNKAGVINKNDEIVKAEEYRGKINIKCHSIEQVVSSLSGGNQQKVVLAKWMLADPDVLILDEPTRGIDVGAKYEIYTIINDLVTAGKSVIVISSDMVELLGICDRVYVINEGEIAGELNKNEMSQERIMKTIMTHLARDKSKAGETCA